MNVHQLPLAWSSALPAREGYYLGSEGKTSHILRLGIIKQRIGVVLDIKKAQYYFWLVSNKLPNKVNNRWIIMLVEPCLINPNDIVGEGATILCLSQLTYLRFASRCDASKSNGGKIVYVTDPLFNLSPVEAQKINSLVWGNQLQKKAETTQYDAVISAVKSNQPLVTWINPPLYLKDVISQNLENIKESSKMKRILFIWKRIPTTVIVLERDPERVFHVKNKLLPKIRGLQWFPAIDGEKKNNLTDLIHQYHLWVKPGLRTGQIGCALSHMQVWSQFVNNPRRDHFMVVLEDDSLLKPDYDQDLQEILREVPFYFDWVYLYVFPKHYRDDEEVQIPGKKVLNKAYNTYCTVGYLISRQGAKKLLQRLKRIDMPLDTIISDEIRQGKLIAFSSKKVIVKNMGQQTSAIEKLGGMPSNVWGTHYFVEQNKIEL